jgi:acyl-CoA synthetase (AMP-forming)/AMP-acid ligase II
MTELSPVITLHHRSPCDAREYLVSNNEFSPDPDDVALYLHTSGTTSAPKGVPLKHRNLIASVKNIIGTYDLCQGDRDIIVMPLFHVHGLVAGLMSSLAAGGTVILPEAGKFSASTFYRDALEHGITWYTAVPTIHQILLKTAEDSQGQIQYSKLGLRFIRSCSASLPPSLLAKIEEAFMAPGC